MSKKRGKRTPAGSKKGKRSWRKINTDDITESLAEQSRKERQRENFEKVPDADLFFVDGGAPAPSPSAPESGEDEAAAPPPLPVAPRLSKKQLARSRALRAEAILAASRAAVPVASTLVGRSGEKRERARAAAARPEALRKKFGSTKVAEWTAEGARGETEPEKAEGKSRPKKGRAEEVSSAVASILPPPAPLRDGTPSEDPWDAAPAFKKHHRALIEAGALSGRVPVGERRRRLPGLAANRQAAVVSKRAVAVAGAGLSYNPDPEAHAEALAEAVAAAVQEDLKKELAPQAPPREVDREAVELAARKDEEQLLDLLEGHGKAFFDRAVKSVRGGKDDGEDDEEGDEEDAGAAELGGAPGAEEAEEEEEEEEEEESSSQSSGDEDLAAETSDDGVPSAAATLLSARPKTKADRARQRRHKDSVEAMRRASRQKAKSRDLQRLTEVIAEVETEEEQKERLRLRREADALERAKAPPRRVGGGTFAPLPSRVLLTEEVGKPLRLLRPMPALALERFRSIQERGLVPIPVKRKIKKRKVKRIEYIPGSRGEADLEAKQAADEERAQRKREAKARKKALAQQQSDGKGGSDLDW